MQIINNYNSGEISLYRVYIDLKLNTAILKTRKQNCFKSLNSFVFRNYSETLFRLALLSEKQSS